MTAPGPEEAPEGGPEAAWLRGADPLRRRRLAQWFTPFPVAAFMARWVLDAPSPVGLLDPAFGLGVFARAASAASEGGLRFTGFEIDPGLAAAAAEALRASSPRLALDLRVGDFLAAPWEERFDGILCNPPWLHFRRHPEREARRAEVEARLGLRLGGQANLHSLFLLKALHQLAPGGRAAFLLPAEWLDAGYGSAVKARLLAEGLLRHVVAFPARAGLFPGAVTTACVLLLAREAAGQAAVPGADGGGAELAFHRADSPEDLPALYRERVARRNGGPGTRRLPASAADPGRKWRGYWQETPLTGYPASVPLGTFAGVLRGIATGCNAFFTLDRAARTAAGLPENCLAPCVTHARDAAGAVFRAEDLRELEARGRRTWLLDAEGREGHPAVAAYLREGLARGAHRRFLTARRVPWYALERRPPAPLWVTVFNRGGPRPVLNLAGARNLTAFHCLYPREGAEGLVEPLFCWLLTGAARRAAGAHGREYGSGLGKVEPLDLAGTPVPDLRRLGEAGRRALRALTAELAAGTLGEAAAAAEAAAIFARHLPESAAFPGQAFPAAAVDPAP